MAKPVFPDFISEITRKVEERSAAAAARSASEASSDDARQRADGHRLGTTQIPVVKASVLEAPASLADGRGLRMHVGDFRHSSAFVSAYIDALRQDPDLAQLDITPYVPPTPMNARTKDHLPAILIRLPAPESAPSGPGL